MFSDHFGLVHNPFTPLSTASSGPFRSKELEEALAHFQYARMNRESFFLLVGEVGTGKSTAVRAIVDSLGPAFPVAVLSHTRLDPRELLEEVLRRFGVDSRGAANKSQLLGRLEAFLLNRTEESPAVLIIDEAHVLSHAALEELRLLSNLEHGDRPLLQICLVGQPELVERLRQHRLRPLRQRIAVRYVFGSLTRQETRDYIRHRLAAAGAAHPAAIFSDDAVDAVHSMAEGLPREINVLAGQAMLNAYLEGSTVVRRSHVRTTKHDYGFEGVRVARGGDPAAPPLPRAHEEMPEPPPPVAPPVPPPLAPIPRRTAPLEPPRSIEPPQRSKPRETEPSELVLQDEEDISFPELQSSSRGWRTLLIATVVVAVGGLATVAFLLYPRNLVGKAMTEPPPPPTSPNRVDPPQSERAPAPPAVESPPPTTTTAPPRPELAVEEDPAEQTAVVTSVTTTAPPPISLPPQPVSRAATAADRLERGTWLARSGSLDEAIAAFREALAIEPGYIDALYNLGSSLLEKGEIAEAVEVLRRATSISPNHGLAQRTLGIALRQSGAVVEAAASLSRAVELMPNDVFALRHLASVLRESGDLEESVDASRRAAALRPDDAGLQQELGFSLRQAGHLDEATAALQRSIEIDGSLAVAHYTLGVTLLEMGNKDAGERAIAEARRLGYAPR